MHEHFEFFQDFSLNLEEVKELTQEFHPELVIIESGGDNLAANFSRELADYIIYVIDVAGTLLTENIVNILRIIRRRVHVKVMVWWS